MDPLHTRPTLLLRIRNSADDLAWREFVDLYTPLVYNFACARGLSPADAADVVQETLRSVALAIGNFDYDPALGTFRSWLYTVARSKLNNHFRTRARNPAGSARTTIIRMVEEHPDPADAEEQWELAYRQRVFHWAAEKIQHEFQSKTWEAFWRVAVEHQTASTVASDLDISVGALYVAKSRVIARLRQTIESLGDSWEPQRTPVTP